MFTTRIALIFLFFFCHSHAMHNAHQPVLITPTIVPMQPQAIAYVPCVLMAPTQKKCPRILLPAGPLPPRPLYNRTIIKDVTAPPVIEKKSPKTTIKSAPIPIKKFTQKIKDVLPMHYELNGQKPLTESQLNQLALAIGINKQQPYTPRHYVQSARLLHMVEPASKPNFKQLIKIIERELPEQVKLNDYNPLTEEQFRSWLNTITSRHYKTGTLKVYVWHAGLLHLINFGHASKNQEQQSNNASNVLSSLTCSSMHDIESPINNFADDLFFDDYIQTTENKTLSPLTL